MISYFPKGLKTVRIYTDDFLFSGWSQNLPDFFQMIAHFPDSLKTVRIFQLPRCLKIFDFPISDHAYKCSDYLFSLKIARRAGVSPCLEEQYKA